MTPLGGQVAAAFNGFNLPVEASHWLNWKPTKSKGFIVGVSFGPLVNSTQTTLYNGIVAGLKASPLVSKVIPYATTSINVASQIPEYQSLVEQHVNLIVYEPLESNAMVAPVNAAGAAGIPSVAVNGQVASPDSVNFTPNSYLFGAEGGATLFSLIGDKGNVLRVDGVPGTSINDQAVLGFDDALKLCPNVHVAGTVTGEYSIGVAQTATLQFLSSHPTPLAGAWDAGTMATGVINAFLKLGRTVPPMFSSTVNQGFLAYWSSKASSGYKAAALVVSPRSEAAGAAYTALKMLKGDGVKVNSIVLAPAAITSSNLSQWNSGTDTQAQGAAYGPANIDAEVRAYADKFFRK